MNVRVKISVTGVTAEARAAYRGLRRLGVDRSAANHIVFGFMLGRGVGNVKVEREAA